MDELPIILVIEDDQHVQSIVEEALTEGGFECAIVASGEEAVTLLRGSKATPIANLALSVETLSSKTIFDGNEILRSC